MTTKKSLQQIHADLLAIEASIRKQLGRIKRNLHDSGNGMQIDVTEKEIVYDQV